MPEITNLNGKVVVVTGGARGIGRVSAAALTAAGARVAIGDLDGARAGELAAALGGGAIGLALDVSSRGSFEAFLAEVERRLGPLDVLVNNAGILPLGEFATEPDAVTEHAIGVNFGGTAIGCKLALKQMLADGRGQILNIAPAPWLVRVPGAAGYNAAGHAVIALTRSLRAELRGSGVRVKLLLVGPTDTDMLVGLHRPRFLRPRPAADVGVLLVAALGSDRSEFSTGRLAGAFSRWRSIHAGLIGLWLRMTRTDRLLRERDTLARAAYQARIEPPARGRDRAAAVANAAATVADAVRGEDRVS
jgi:NAD(P)-dependent dehydrogenase (short-subunit alcohol dehydrogenase family)